VRRQSCRWVWSTALTGAEGTRFYPSAFDNSRRRDQFTSKSSSNQAFASSPRCYSFPVVATRGGQSQGQNRAKVFESEDRSSCSVPNPFFDDQSLSAIIPLIKDDGTQKYSKCSVSWGKCRHFHRYAMALLAFSLHPTTEYSVGPRSE
jgi:hypothetical protein